MGNVIGIGSNCKVREAINIKTGERVAVKKITIQSSTKGSEAFSFIMREIRAYKMLNHVNVICLIDAYAKVVNEKSNELENVKCIKYGDGHIKKVSLNRKNSNSCSSITIKKYVPIRSVDDIIKCNMNDISKFCMVFEFCICTLAEYIEQHIEVKMKENTSKAYFVQIMRGVEYIHSRGLVRK